MAEKYTKEQLEKMQFSVIIEAFLAMQENLSAMQESYAVLEQNYTNLNNTMQIMMEQLADQKRHLFGRSTMVGQLSRQKSKIFLVNHVTNQQTNRGSAVSAEAVELVGNRLLIPLWAGRVQGVVGSAIDGSIN